MTAKERLEELLSHPVSCGKWIIGNIPKDYKRCNIDDDEKDRLARLGYKRMFGFYNEDIRLYYTQSMIAGAVLSGDYDEIIVVTCSQYGKSWLMGRIGLIMAYDGIPTYIGASNKAGTEIIMQHVMGATCEAEYEVQMQLEGVNASNVDRLRTAVNKNKIMFPKSGGFVEGLTLGGSYESLGQNQAVGRGGAYILDECALIPDNSIKETARAELANINGKKYPRIYISNPHSMGIFYDKLTQELPPRRTLIVWADALTALEEGRFTKQQILSSDYANHRDTLVKYWLCELDEVGNSMFDVPIVSDIPRENTTYFLGIDSAYKGKDNISVSLCSVNDEGMKIEEITDLYKGEWIDGVTSEDILNQIVRIYRAFNVQYVCVDIGMGVWLVEGLIKRGVLCRGVHFQERPDKERLRAKHYAAVNATNKRAELHLDLQDLIEHRAICFSTQAYNEIKNVLPLVTCKRNSNGKVQIVAKDSIKAKIKGKSPDELDACLLSIQAAIMYSAYNCDYIV